VFSVFSVFQDFALLHTGQVWRLDDLWAARYRLSHDPLWRLRLLLLLRPLHGPRLESYALNWSSR